mmetsp:Transcript_18042/g.41471  ORF Transcript_18042/g.41471 Transcript_18042/m.41471 type:complete len:92 (+) Transcript_18042:196-471(+)
MEELPAPACKQGKLYCWLAYGEKRWMRLPSFLKIVLASSSEDVPSSRRAVSNQPTLREIYSSSLNVAWYKATFPAATRKHVLFQFTDEHEA